MSGARAALEGRAAAVRRVFLGLLVANAAVVAAKTIIAVRTGSLSVLGDAIHSSVDELNNSIAGLLHDTPPPVPTLPEFGLLGLTLVVDHVIVHLEPC